MTDPGLEFLDELGTIGESREDTLGRLTAKNGFTKAPSSADSGINIQTKKHDTSLEELTGKRATETENKAV
jgi:hypothetical protein